MAKIFSNSQMGPSDDSEKDKGRNESQRQYPALYEKGVPIALAIIAVAIVALLIIIFAVATGLFSGVG